MADVLSRSRGDDWFFDCDGVLLDSNEVKTRAFADVARAYGDAAAEALVDHHRAHGGVSRFVKWRHFFDGILGREPEPGELQRVLEAFASRSLAGVRQAAVDPAAATLVRELRESGSRCHVVSGAAEDELRLALDEAGLARLFDGVHGSPATKVEIVDRVRSAPDAPGIFVGDSRLDHEVAESRGLSFVFVSHWTEFRDWEPYFRTRDALVVRDLADLRARIGTTEGSLHASTDH